MQTPSPHTPLSVQHYNLLWKTGDQAKLLPQASFYEWIKAPRCGAFSQKYLFALRQSATIVFKNKLDCEEVGKEGKKKNPQKPGQFHYCLLDVSYVSVQ